MKSAECGLGTTSRGPALRPFSLVKAARGRAALMRWTQGIELARHPLEKLARPGVEQGRPLLRRQGKEAPVHGFLETFSVRGETMAVAGAPHPMHSP